MQSRKIGKIALENVELEEVNDDDGFLEAENLSSDYKFNNAKIYLD